MALQCKLARVLALVDFVAEFVRVICTSYSYAGGAVVIVDDVLDAAEANAGVVVQTTGLTRQLHSSYHRPPSGSIKQKRLVLRPG